MTATTITAKPARKPRRIFRWTFAAIQAAFIGLIVLYGTESTGAPASQVHAGCDHGAWQGLFKSHSDCMVHYAAGLNGAGHAGQAVGIGLVIFLWFIVDVVILLGRLVVLHSRKRSAR